MESNFIFENEKGIYNLNENKGYLIAFPIVTNSVRNYDYPLIQGKNGSKIIDYGTYADREIEVEFCNEEAPNLSFFDGTGGRVFFNFENSFYYKVKSVTNSSKTYDGWLYKTNLKMLVEPFKYLYDEKITILKNTTIENKGDISSEPYLKIYGNGNLKIKINSELLEFLDVVDYIEIDCEELECFKDNVELNNKFIGDFPVLNVGENTIEFIENITKVEIIPRWRCL